MDNKLNDYSGPAVNNLKLSDFSYEFVLKLAKEYQSASIKGYEYCFKWIEKRLGKEEADKFDAEYWTYIAKTNWTRMAKLANIQVTDVLEAMKVGQIILEGTMPFQPLTTFECVNGNKNHVIWTANRCLNLEYMEKYDRSRIKNMCEVIEDLGIRRLMELWFTDVEVKALKLPPRKGPDDVPHCKWEIKSSGIRKT